MRILLDSYKLLREKARLEQPKDVVCWFEQILKIPSNKTAGVWPCTSHHTNHLNKMSKICWALAEFSYEHISIGWPAKTYIYHVCVDTRCYQEELLRDMSLGMDDKRKSRECLLLAYLDEIYMIFQNSDSKCLSILNLHNRVNWMAWQN